ncbi:MAG: hypothetical protein ACKVYV_08665 [Limisphaerales bacterium]
MKLPLVSTAISVATVIFGADSAGLALAGSFFSDFSFGSGTPFVGTTNLAGVQVTIVTTNTEPNPGSPNAFRDFANTEPALVSFTFSAPIDDFYLDVSFVRADEMLTDFNIGQPISLSGTLVNVTGSVTTGGADDNGFGRLTWRGIHTNLVTFTIGNFPNPGLSPALAIERFGFGASSQLSIRASQVELCWDTATNYIYQLQYLEDMSTNGWLSFGSPMLGTGTRFCTNDSILVGQPRRFYQLLITNAP